ncbi:hypothetical protein [Bacillus sp. V3-13]|uniref:hypothetical protein n=1 Tax=Bacillus sp. V3-13 TaxID=2053728 RepID=UPI0015E08118|nr:hypothetical protein [Bacillus sp. V3-13]
MCNSGESADRLEKLLESLITMLGKTNGRVDDLAKRVNQLEMYVTESAKNKPNPSVYTFISEAEKAKLPRNSKTRKSIATSQ